MLASSRDRAIGYLRHHHGSRLRGWAGLGTRLFTDFTVKRALSAVDPSSFTDFTAKHGERLSVGPKAILQILVRTTPCGVNLSGIERNP